MTHVQGTVVLVLLTTKTSSDQFGVYPLAKILQQLLEILFAELLSDQHLKLFIYLNKVKLVYNCL